MPEATQAVQSKADFLCIGAPKCGTTWLHSLLATHPSLFLPTQIKEIHYFDRYRDRGDNWYNNFFSSKNDSQLAGDVTPHYLYADDYQYIKDYNPNILLILIHRDPVDRCVSHYKYRQRLDNYTGTFQDFLRDYPQAIDWGLYGKYLSNFCGIFPPEQILVVKFEDAVNNVAGFKKLLSSYLGIDANQFPENAGYAKVNQDINVKNQGLYRLSVKISRVMVDYNLYTVRHFLKKLLLGFLKRESRGAVQHAKPSSDDLAALKATFLDDQQLFSQLQRHTIGRGKPPSDFTAKQGTSRSQTKDG